MTRWRGFVFSCLTFDLRTGTSVKRRSFLGLTSLLRWSCVVPDLLLRRRRIPSVKFGRLIFSDLRVLLHPSVFAFLMRAETFPVFVSRLGRAVIPHLSPERHQPSCEKTLGIQYSVQRTNCCASKKEAVIS